MEKSLFFFSFLIKSLRRSQNHVSMIIGLSKQIKILHFCSHCSWDYLIVWLYVDK